MFLHKNLQLFSLIILNHENKIVLQANSGVGLRLLFCFRMIPHAEDVNNAANHNKSTLDNSPPPLLKVIIAATRSNY